MFDRPDFDVECDVILHLADRLDRVIGDDFLRVKDLVTALDLADHFVAVDALIFVGLGPDVKSHGNGHSKVLLFLIQEYINIIYINCQRLENRLIRRFSNLFICFHIVLYRWRWWKSRVSSHQYFCSLGSENTVLETVSHTVSTTRTRPFSHYK